MNTYPFCQHGKLDMKFFIWGRNSIAEQNLLYRTFPEKLMENYFFQQMLNTRLCSLFEYLPYKFLFFIFLFRFERIKRNFPLHCGTELVKHPAMVRPCPSVTLEVSELWCKFYPLASNEELVVWSMSK